MSTIINIPTVNTRVYNSSLLQWENAKQPVISTDSLTVSMAGVSTAANQTTGNTSLASILTELQSILSKLNASLAVTGSFWQATQPISAASLPLPSGASTEATLETVKTNLDRLAMTAASGTVSSLGNNTVITPASGKRLSIAYLSYNPALAVEAGFRLGAAGTLMLKNSLTAGGSVIAKDFGDFRHVLGAIDEPLILNLSLAVSTNWNVFYREV